MICLGLSPVELYKFGLCIIRLQIKTTYHRLKLHFPEYIGYIVCAGELYVKKALIEPKDDVLVVSISKGPATRF